MSATSLTRHADGTDRIIAPPGLANVVVADTEIGDVRGTQGFYHYREYSAIDLARQCSFEEVWYLMLERRLPDAQQLEDFRAEIAAARELPASYGALLDTIVAATPRARVLDGLRTALSVLAAYDGAEPSWERDPAALRRDAVRIAAVVPVILGRMYARQVGREPLLPQPGESAAASWLRMITGRAPTAAQESAIAAYLIATIDHGFNASTFAGRVVSSTGADVIGAVRGDRRLRRTAARRRARSGTGRARRDR